MKGIWVSPSFDAFSSEATGGTSSKWVEVTPGHRNELTLRSPPPPVIVAGCGALPPPYPILEGRHRQPLPKLAGQRRGALLAGLGDRYDQSVNSNDLLDAWLVPWRVGTERSLVITLEPSTVLVLDVSQWPEPQDIRLADGDLRPRDRILRHAACLLDAAPSAFATEPAVSSAYDRLKVLWNDRTLGQSDPLGDLLARQAKKLRGILEDLSARPRAVLRSEHRMLKLQAARRIDAKTLRWFSAQPGRNTAERAGARQRIKAAKRYETMTTLENGVLRAFAALTVREAKTWLAGHSNKAAATKSIEAHLLRCRRIESALRERKVPEATPPVEPNFPLRFDQRYREIWRAWQELRRSNIARELEWMWQSRTFMELLSLRAAMMLHEAIRDQSGAGVLAHHPVLKDKDAPSQGRYLDEGIRCTLGIIQADSLNTIEYQSEGGDYPLGAVASAGPGAEVWWDASDVSMPAVGVGELPWTPGHAWDTRLRKWAQQVAS